MKLAPAKRRHENKPQRLAESLSPVEKHARAKRSRKNTDRPKPGRNSRRAMAGPRDLSPLARLVQSLGEEEIRFQIVGMSAAILQGVPATTTDTDIWVDLPERQCVRLLSLVTRQGGTPMAPTLYGLSDGSVVNFIFSMTGLRQFASEYARSVELIWNGIKVRVLPLKRIYQSKRASGRDKDIAHLPLLRNVMRGQRLASVAPGHKQARTRKKGERA